MKKIHYLLILVLSIFIIGEAKAEETKIDQPSPTAKERVTIDELVRVINSGEVTTEYITDKMNEKIYIEETDTEIERYKDFKINATYNNNVLTVTSDYIKSDSTVEQKSVDFTYYESGNYLYGKINYNEKEYEQFEEQRNIIDMLSVWEVEASSKFPNIKKYIQEGYRRQFIEYFTPANLQIKHVLTTSVNTKGNTEYYTKVQLTEEPGKYILDCLKADKKSKDTKELMFKLLVAMVILVVLISFCKSIKPEQKKSKFDFK